MNFKENYQDILNLCHLTANSKFMTMTAFDMLSELYIELQDSEFTSEEVINKLKSIIYRDKDKLPILYTDDVVKILNIKNNHIESHDIVVTKKCTLCKKIKNLKDDFYHYHRKGFNQTFSRCKECYSKHGSAKTKYQNNKDYFSQLTVPFITKKLIRTKQYTELELIQNPQIVLDRIEKIKKMRERKKLKMKNHD